MASKRSRGDPTGLTPVQPSKKPSSKLRSLLTGHQVTSLKKKLFAGGKDPSSLWTPEEASLVDYILRRGYEDWPASHPLCTELWEGAARYLSEKGHTTKRTSK